MMRQDPDDDARKPDDVARHPPMMGQGAGPSPGRSRSGAEGVALAHGPLAPTPASTDTERRSVTAHSTPTRASGRTARSSRPNGSENGVAPYCGVWRTAEAPALA